MANTIRQLLPFRRFMRRSTRCNRQLQDGLARFVAAEEQYARQTANKVSKSFPLLPESLTQN